MFGRRYCDTSSFHRQAPCRFPSRASTRLPSSEAPALVPPHSERRMQKNLRHQRLATPRPWRSPSDPEAIESRGRRGKLEATLLRFGTTLRSDRQVDSDSIAKCECDTIALRSTNAALLPAIRSPTGDIHISTSARAITIAVRVACAAVKLALKRLTMDAKTCVGA